MYIMLDADMFFYFDNYAIYVFFIFGIFISYIFVKDPSGIG